MKLFVKGLEQVRPPKDIREWEAGEPHQEKAMTTKALGPESGPPSVEKSTMNATALLMIDNLIKACSKKGVRLMPDAGMAKGEEGKEKQQPADKPPFTSVQAKPAKEAKNPLSMPGSGSHFRFSLGKGEAVKKDLEHMAGEYKKIAPTAPTQVAEQSKQLGFSKPAMFEGSAAKKQAMGAKTPTQGATGAVKDPNPDILTSAPAEPKMAPKTPSLKPGQTISMQSAVSKPKAPSAPTTPASGPLKPGSVISMQSVASKPQQQKTASMTKSAIEILKGMIEKASAYPGNPDRENGPVHGTPHGGRGPAQTSVSGRESPGNASQENGPVRGAAFAGRDGNQNGEVHGTPHGGSGPAQTSVRGFEGPGNDSQMNKGSGALEGMEHKPTGMPLTGKHAAGYETAVADHKRGMSVESMKPHGSDHPEWAAGYRQGVQHIKEGKVSKAVGAMAVPRMPRAMAMAMDTWRSATRVLTRGNSAFSQQVGSGPLHGEIVDQMDGPSFESATRHGPVLKACSSCGRTYTLHKSDDGCPSCSRLPYSNMAKSRGGYLIPSSIQ